ncbi:MAG: DMT family transporter [Bdellovibrionales bacterium]|nr:DMT family transporter [Bdellovibrionales bacterium]
MSGILFVILAGVLWAIDTLIRYPLLGAGVAAEKIVFVEHLFLSIIFIPLLLKDAKKIGSIKLSTIFYFVVIGVCGSAIGTLTFTKAFMLINPSLVILLQKLQPIVAISLASVLLGEKIKKEFLIWAAVALFGGFLISSPDIMPGLAQLDFSMGLLSQGALWGYSLALIAVVSWGASTVAGKKLTGQGFDEIQIMGGRFVFGLVFMTFYLLYRFAGLNLEWGPAVYGKVLLMVFLSGLAGMYFYYKGLKTLSARACALAEMFFPFSAVIINWVFLGAKLLPIQIVGAALLVISSSVIQIKKY